MNRALDQERARLRKGRALEMLSDYEEAYQGQQAPHVRQSLITESTGVNADPVLKAVREQLESGRIDTKALPADIAVIELRRGAGTQFDAQVVEAFVAAGREQPTPTRNLVVQAQESCSY